MPTTVHLAPVGTGKTAYALHRLLEFVHNPKQPFSKVWVLLATQRQETAFRQRLVDLQTTHTVYFNVEFFNFYTLNTRLLNIAGKPQRQIEGSARVSLLRIIIDEMLAQSELTFFRDIAHTAGFITVLTDLITELKQNSVTPEQFAISAQTAKDHEIAAIYHQYQQQLIHNNLADLEGIAWQALATLKSTPSIADDVDLLLVDGYDQFTPIQAQLLAELSRTITNVDITLTTVPNQANYAHRFQRALDRLKKTHAKANITFTQQTIITQATSRHPDLEQLRQLIFQGIASHPTSDAIQLIEMPTPLEEVMAILRAVKRQLIDGVRPDDIIIIMRDWTHYETFFESYRLLYDLPLLLHRHTTYHKTPVISVILDLLELAPNFRRRDVLDILHSPYIDAGLSPEQLEQLDTLTREKQFVRGTKQEWLDMINFASTTPPNDDEDHDRDTNESLLTMDDADILCHKLALFFDGITPPVHHSVAPYVAWLESLIGHAPDPEQDIPDDNTSFSLHIVQQVQANTTATEDLKNRDITALNGMKRILQDQLKTDDFVRSTLNADHTINWHTLWADLKFSLQHTLDTPSNPSRSGRVLVTTANNARGLHHDHVYILGMAEGVFPAEISEDPLYLDSERQRLQADGVFIETQAERTDDQGLFYELISLPRTTLTLSRPTVQDGKIWIESHLWRAVRMVYPELALDTMAVGQVVHPSHAASHDELLLAVANQLNQADASHPDVEQSLRIQNWLKHDHSLRTMWSQILRGRTIDSKRLSSEPYDNYSGYLLHPKLQDAAAELLGADHIWSASQLKDYGLCGFRYYAKRLLKLEAINDPEEGYDILQLGLINHSILEHTYTELRNNKTDITPENLDDALTVLRQHAQRILTQAPQELNFRESVIWEQEKSVILQRLEALVKLDFSGNSPLNTFGEQRRIYQLERYFQDVEIPLADDIGALKIRGFIDRIDRIDGDKLVVLDYKTGTTKINTTEMSDGRDFQMMTYILALQHILQTTDTNLELAGGMFWHLRNLEASGIFKVGDADDQQAIESARRHITNNLRKGRAGKFPVHANHIEDGKCSRYCDYSHLCRMSITNRHKPES